MVNNVQEIRPERACEKVYANYSSFKPYLRDDFNKRCGYCDCDDYHIGGSRGYQIDHFRPKKKFTSLANDYSNLVYSCPYCNRAKWDKWKNDNGFIDPCSDEYNDHLYRNEVGQIFYHTERGKYIFEELKLGLERHETIWQMRRLEEQRDALSQHIETRIGDDSEDILDILLTFKKIQDQISLYTNRYRSSI